MMRARLLKLTAAIFILLPFSVRSDPLLSLNEAIDEALSNNPLLLSKSLRTQSYQSKINSAAALADPKIGLAFENYPVTDFQDDQFEMTGQTLSLSQELPLSDKRELRREKARRTYHSEEAKLAQAKAALAKRLKSFYFKYFLLAKERSFSQQKLSALKQALQVSQADLSSAAGNLNAVLQLQSREAMLRRELIRNENELALARSEINHLLGRTEYGVLWKTEEIAPQEIKIQQLNENKLLELALSNNPIIKRVNEESLAAISEEKLRQAEFYPDIDLMLGYTFRERTANAEGDDFVSAGVSLSIPLWADSKQGQEYASSILKRRSREALLLEEKNHIAHYAHALISEVRSADAAFRLVRDELRPISRKILKDAESKYSAGSLSFLELLQAREENLNSELYFFQILVERETKLAELEELLNCDAKEELSRCLEQA